MSILANRKIFVLLLLLFLLSFAFCLSIIFSHSVVLRSHHGLFHAGFIYQALNGVFPPQHPAAAGVGASWYWPWYGFVAGLMLLFQLSSFEIIGILNSFSFALSMVMMVLIAREFGFRWSLSFAIAILSITLFRTLQGLSVLLSHVFTLDNQSHFLNFWSQLVGIPQRRHFGAWLINFFNQASFPTLVGLFFLAVYCIVFTEKNGRLSFACGILMAFFITLIGYFNAIVLYGLDIFFVSYLLFDSTAPNSDNAKIDSLVQFIRTMLGRYWWIIVPNILTLPFIIFLANTVGSPGVTLSIERIYTALLGKGEAPPLMLLSLIALFICRKKHHIWPLFGVILAYLLCSIFIRLPKGNEFKLFYLSSFFVTLGIATFLRFGQRIIQREAILALLLLGLAAPSWYQLSKAKLTPYLANRPQIFLLDHTYVRLNPKRPIQRSLQQVCDWLHHNTPLDSYIIRKNIHLDDILIPVVAERRLFFARTGTPRRVRNSAKLERLNRQLIEKVRQTGNFILASRDPLRTSLSTVLPSTEQLYLLEKRHPAPRKTDRNPKSVVFQNTHFRLHKLIVEDRAE